MLVPIPANPNCDFCQTTDGPMVACMVTSEKVAGAVNAKGESFELPTNPHWLACAVCHVLVKQRDPDRLAEYCYHTGLLGDVPLEWIKTTQRLLFWDGFEGEEHSVRDHPTYGEG